MITALRVGWVGQGGVGVYYRG
ncbi:hypothetical protein MILUP08_40888 [Micromonospora lupini str. Lupac 08]|uniref:Uncharacterized protein n=1 Tax=Micromonospora lupini str. Lupac 08 TaxID=1150864 RepID=I0KWN0_9ACTN|nr:hypothetical protein MILUP08_40888 [Micromonospora lupini str. Lupac 08]